MDNQLAKNKIADTFSLIKDVTIRYIGEKNNNFTGLSDREISDLEIKYQITFPEAYKCFLKTLVGGRLKIFDHQNYNIEGIESAHEVASEILLVDKVELPKSSFVFSQWQGYQFYYFINTQDGDPDTFQYIEGGGTEQSPPMIYNVGKFTYWILKLAINCLNLQSRLHKYEVTEGIALLNKQLDDLTNNIQDQNI